MSDVQERCKSRFKVIDPFGDISTDRYPPKNSPFYVPTEIALSEEAIEDLYLELWESYKMAIGTLLWDGDLSGSLPPAQSEHWVLLDQILDAIEKTDQLIGGLDFRLFDADFIPDDAKPLLMAKYAAGAALIFIDETLSDLKSRQFFEGPHRLAGLCLKIGELKGHIGTLIDKRVKSKKAKRKQDEKLDPVRECLQNLRVTAACETVAA